jgi:hypothetical protein
MALLIGSFWRAVGYCLYPRVMALSILPLALMVVAAFALGYWFWDPAVDAVLHWLEGWELLTFALNWLASIGLDNLRSVFAPLVVLVLATPLLVVFCLLLVALFMTPAMLDLVALRRFPQLERRQGGGFWGSLGWSLWSTGVALLALVVSLPFWLIPPLVLVLPPLIWGWLTYRVFAYDALAAHASREERVQLLAQHRIPLLAMGVFAGLLGAAPSVLWASGAMFIALAPLLVPLALWVYTLVFAFASLWFSHYLLTALESLRASSGNVEPAVVVGPGSSPPSPNPPGGPVNAGQGVATPLPPGSSGHAGGDIIDVQARTLP